MPNISTLLLHDTDEVVKGAAAFFLNGHMLARIWKEQGKTHVFLHDVVHENSLACTAFTGKLYRGAQADQLLQQLNWLVEVNHLLHKMGRVLSASQVQKHVFPLSSAVWNTCLETPKGQACIARWKEKGVYIAMERQDRKTFLHLSRHPCMRAA